ncbi:MAG TPA: hypothetical protein VD905_03370 [Flavobacteriales bacterium]|nr:hypothetical protein [Flavobacteriales bacterium]
MTDLKIFKDNERELVNLVTFFKKRVNKFMEQGKLGEEYKQLIESCDKLTGALGAHAERRNKVQEQREQLKKLVKDNAVCPKCNSNENLKHTGVDTNEKGWKSNKYKCRRCNIEFVWARPNNPWDMLAFVEDFLHIQNSALDTESPEKQEQTKAVIAQMEGNVAALKPVIEASDTDYKEMQERDAEMAKIIREFKTQLLIEKVKLDAMEEGF